ncbi:DUF3558 family protein [Actinophytocola sediminis]
MNRAVTTAALLVGAASLTVLTACGGESTAGEPTSADRQVDQTSSEPPPSTDGDESAADYSLSQLCGLLEPAEAQRLGGSAQGREGNSISDGHDICTWENETSLIAGVQPGLDLSSVRPSEDVTVTQTTVDGLTAVKKQTASINACEIVVELPGENLFGVSAAPLSAGEGKYEPCAVADEFAAIAIPRVKDD